MAESKRVVVYTLLASAIVMVAFAAIVWTQLIDIGMDPKPLVALLLLGAVGDVVFAVIFLRRLTSR